MFVAAPIDNGIVPSVSGVDSSRDNNRFVCVLVDFDSGQDVPGLIQFGTKF